MANVPLPNGTVTRRIEKGNFVIGREYTAPANLAANDTLEIGNVPPGGRLLQVYVTCDAAIAGTVDIGTVADGDRFQDGDNGLATANRVVMGDLGLGAVLSEDDDTLVRVTFLTDAPNADDVVRAWMIVAVDGFGEDETAAV